MCFFYTSSRHVLTRSKQPKFLSGHAKIDNRRETAPFIANKRAEVATFRTSNLILRYKGDATPVDINLNYTRIVGIGRRSYETSQTPPLFHLSKVDIQCVLPIASFFLSFFQIAESKIKKSMIFFIINKRYR